MKLLSLLRLLFRAPKLDIRPALAKEGKKAIWWLTTTRTIRRGNEQETLSTNRTDRKLPLVERVEMRGLF